MGTMLRLVVVLLGLASCARDNLFVLVPQADGSTGAIQVMNAAGTQTIDRPNQAVRVGGAGSVPEAPAPLAAAQIDRTWGRAMQAAPRAPRRFLLYFQFGTDKLTPESETALPQILATIREYPAAEVTVIGHTDRVGTDESNLALGRERAEAIHTRLVAIGIPPNMVDATSHGEKNPLVPTADEVPEPRNRRVEVMVR